jgi:hypothetical protein
MALNPLKSAVDIAFTPARLAGRILREVSGGGRGEVAASPPPPPEPAPPAKRRRPARPRPKPLDDVTIARKVESTVFRNLDVDKGKIDVNVAKGVVWLRGEARTPELINQLEERAREVPEVRRVENLLHLPKTPAPSRTDTPPSQRKTRRSKPRPEAQSVSPGRVTEEAPAPPQAEPSPRETAAARKGRSPAPLADEGKGSGRDG